MKKITSKQRAYLRGLGNSLRPVFQIGKAGATEENIRAIETCFNTNELIKIAILQNCGDDPAYLANTAAAGTGSQVVQVIGRKFILYRPFKDEPQIILPR